MRLSMGVLLAILAALLVGGLIASGVVYARQQALVQRQQMLRSLRQKFDEQQNLYDLIFVADSEPDIAIVLNQNLLELARQIRALDSRNPETQALVQQLTSRGTALGEGLLLPKGERTVNSEAALASLLSGYAHVLQKLQRIKIRGQIAPHQYESFALHLRHLTLETEVESHLHSAETRLGIGDRSKAINHFVHARDLLKKTSLEVENRNERIREISDKLKLAESNQEASGGSNPAKDAGREKD